MAKQFTAIDIGGTAIKFGLLDESGQVLESDRMPTKAWEGGPGIMQRTKSIVRRYADVSSGICLSSAGMVDCEKGEIFYSGPTIPNFKGTRFKAELEQTFGLPTEIENDVNCAGLAEAVSGAGRGAASVLCLTIGTGIGGCFVQNGEVYHGHSGSALEIGYMDITGNGRNFQEQGAASVLSARVNELKARPGSGKEEHWSGIRIFEAAKRGDVDCRASIDEMVRVLGHGIATLCYVLNPETVVLGGGIMAQEEYLLPRIRRELDAHLLETIASKTTLRAAAYYNEAGMIGAFYHFRKRHPEIVDGS